MATKTEIDPRWAELQGRGYNLRDTDGDVGVALYYKEAFINDYGQTKVDMSEIIKDAQEHWQEITGFSSTVVESKKEGDK